MVAVIAAATYLRSPPARQRILSVRGGDESVSRSSTQHHQEGFVEVGVGDRADSDGAGGDDDEADGAADTVWNRCISTIGRRKRRRLGS